MAPGIGRLGGGILPHARAGGSEKILHTVLFVVTVAGRSQRRPVHLFQVLGLQGNRRQQLRHLGQGNKGRGLLGNRSLNTCIIQFIAARQKGRNQGQEARDEMSTVPHNPFFCKVQQTYPFHQK